MAATPEVQPVVTSAATQGTIMGISPFSTNSSWEVDFHGPALDCRNVDQTLYGAILNDAETTINKTYEAAKHGDAATYGFLSWVPYDDGTECMMPFYDGVTVMSPGTSVEIMAPRFAELGPIANSVLQGGTVGEGEWAGATALSIFVATFPHIADTPKQDLTDVYRLARDPTIIKCSLYNLSYETNFTYVNGEQEINIKNNTLLNGVGYVDSVGFESGSAGDPSAYYFTW